MAPETDSFRQKLLEMLAANEQAAKADVERAIHRFDSKAWRKWSRSLPERARRVPREGWLSNIWPSAMGASGRFAAAGDDQPQRDFMAQPAHRD